MFVCAISDKAPGNCSIEKMVGWQTSTCSFSAHAGVVVTPNNVRSLAWRLANSNKRSPPLFHGAYSVSGFGIRSSLVKPALGVPQSNVYLAPLLEELKMHPTVHGLHLRR
ncbi:hypothetical protein CBOM_07505 [Ceraceosorus bombacis]|uniref:Uncharacterized protein n=1 Tax=Ceraceosorus bombacis TaxID=401625 RepID=A0A0P1BE59_9BASI|nr:hypothetical protein CBOM_07505 [Ceraceosorus bombacis]